MEYTYKILGLSVLVIIIILIITLYKKSKVNKLKTGEEAFIYFICQSAKKEKVFPEENTTRDYFMKNFESLKLFYVYQTNSFLLLNDVNKTIKKAVKLYCK